MFYTQPPENFTPDFQVVGCYPEYNGKLLFLLRHPSKVQGNTWCVPGGKVDEGETLEQATLRELTEESGIVAAPQDVKFFQTVYKVTPEFRYTFSIFSLKLDSLRDITISPTEHTKYMWVTLEEALQMTLIEDEDKCLQLLYKL